MRKEIIVHVDLEGRDKGKVFKIREMPAEQAEAWGARFTLALMKANVEVPSNFTELGMAAIVVIGIHALGSIPWETAKPLLDEMMGCVIGIFPDPSHPNVMRGLVPDDIEEVQTRAWLRDKIIELHLGFSISGKIAEFRQSAKAVMQTNGQNTPMSPKPSDQLS